MDQEIWKDIDGYKGLYQISNLGRVKSLRQNRIMKPSSNEKGYLRVGLTKNKEYKTVKVHRLVAIAFISNPHNKSEINHINNIRNDNRADNLEWVTHEENMNLTFGKKHLYFKKRNTTYNYVYNFFKDGELIGRYNSLEEMMKDLKISYESIKILLSIPKRFIGCNIKITPCPSKNKKRHL